MLEKVIKMIKQINILTGKPKGLLGSSTCPDMSNFKFSIVNSIHLFV